jgi:hypothetical protein
MCEAWYMELLTKTIDVGVVGEDGAGAESHQYTEVYDEPVNFADWLDTPRTFYSWADERVDYNKKWLSPEPGAALKCAEAIAELSKKLAENESPSTDAILQLDKILADHEKATSANTVDFAGQFQKAVRRKDVDEWLIKIQAVL